MPAKKETAPTTEPTFEQALGRLNVIADTLENETPSLEQALALYEEGAKLLSSCAAKLTEAEARITVLAKNN